MCLALLFNVGKTSKCNCIKIRFTFNPKSVKQNVIISNHTTNTSKQNISDESDVQLRRGGTKNAGLQYARPGNNRLENDGRLC